MRRDMLRYICRPRHAASWAVLLLGGMLAASAQQADPTPPAPAPPSAEDVLVPSAPPTAPPAVARQPKDLHTLFMEEYQRRVAAGESTEGALLRVSTESDGTVVVRNAEGKVLEVYPLEYFSFRNMLSSTTMTQHTAAQEHVTENREAYEAERAKEAEEAAKRREEVEKAETERQEEAWTASAKTYRDPTTGKDVQAVKINPREIRPDGTYERNGQAVKPLRIFNRRTGKYENVVPISAPAP